MVLQAECWRDARFLSWAARLLLHPKIRFCSLIPAARPWLTLRLDCILGLAFCSMTIWGDWPGLAALGALVGGNSWAGTWLRSFYLLPTHTDQRYIDEHDRANGKLEDGRLLGTQALKMQESFHHARGAKCNVTLGGNARRTLVETLCSSSLIDCCPS